LFTIVASLDAPMCVHPNTSILSSCARRSLRSIGLHQRIRRMRETSTASTAFHLGEDAGAQLGGLRWLPPALIGLALPICAVLVLFPGLAQNASILLTVVLAAITIVCAVAFSLTVLLPGDVTAIAADRAARSLEVVRRNPFAVSRKPLAFADVARIELSQRYDDDGYRTELAEILLTDGSRITLPAGTSAADIETLRRILGLSSRAR
jgi:hypothetical protein